MTLESHKCYRKGIQYSITLNGGDNMQFFKDNNIHRPRNCIQGYNMLLKKYFKPYAEYSLMPEISKKGRWHYHGVIEFTDPIGFLLGAAHNIYDVCNIEIDTIKDDQVWKDYCEKDKDIMKPYIKDKELPYLLTHKTVVQSNYTTRHKSNTIFEYLS